MAGLIQRTFKSVGDTFSALFFDTGSGVAHYDAGIGAPTDTAATDNTSPQSLISLARRRNVFLETGTLKTQLQSGTASIGTVTVANPSTGFALDSSLQSILTQLSALASHADEAAELNKLETIRNLLANALTVSGTLGISSLPSIPAGSNKIGSVDIASVPSTVATDASLQSILSVLQAQRAETLWTDDTGTFFVRVDKSGAITWVDPSGNSSSAPGTGARPAAGTTAIVDASRYQAIASGAGYSNNDYLSHIVTLDPQTGVVIGHFWLNVTTETKLAGNPANSDISPITSLPKGAATDATLQSILTQLGLLALHADEAADLAKLESIRVLLSNVLNVTGTITVSSLPALPVGANKIGSVDIASLPASAAKDLTLSTAFGSSTDAVTSDITIPGSSFTFTSLYKGIVANGIALLNRLPASLGIKTTANSLSVTLASDQAAVPVSLAVSPLPSGAATLSAQNTIATNQNVTAAGTSATNAQAIQGVTGGVPLATTIRSAGTNRSGNVTTATANLMAANANRQGWKIKNDSTVGIWINFDAVATAVAGSGNIFIPAGSYLSSEPGFVETGAMSAIAASGTAAITAREH